MSCNNPNDYMQHLLTSIENKRRFGIENAHKTDLYTSDELLDFMNWFNELIKLVIKTPPSYYVRVVNIIEGKDGNILSIHYDLFPENAHPEESELNIQIFSSHICGGTP